jgi:hypothetical protein
MADQGKFHTKKRASHEKKSSSRITEIWPFFCPSPVAPTAVWSSSIQQDEQ